jgi:hypothetical protein
MSRPTTPAMQWSAYGINNICQYNDKQFFYDGSRAKSRNVELFQERSHSSPFQFKAVYKFVLSLWFNSVQLNNLQTNKHFIINISWVRLSPLGTAAATGLLYLPRMIDDGDCGATDGMKNGRGNRGTRRKPAPVPLCPPQIPHDLTRVRTRAAAAGSQRLTAWAMTRPKRHFNNPVKILGKH